MDKRADSDEMNVEVSQVVAVIVGVIVVVPLPEVAQHFLFSFLVEYLDFACFDVAEPDADDLMIHGRESCSFDVEDIQRVVVSSGSRHRI